MSVTVNIELGNEAMQTAEDAAEALRTIARRIEEGFTSGLVNDRNGNRAGWWKSDGFTDYEADEAELREIAPEVEAWAALTADEERDRQDEYPGAELIGRYAELCERLDEAGRPAVI